MSEGQMDVNTTESCVTHVRCRAKMAHTRQSRPDPGLGFQVKVLETFKLFPLRSEAVSTVSGDLKPMPGEPAFPPSSH